MLTNCAGAGGSDSTIGPMAGRDIVSRWRLKVNAFSVRALDKKQACGEGACRTAAPPRWVAKRPIPCNRGLSDGPGVRLCGCFAAERGGAAVRQAPLPQPIPLTTASLLTTVFRVLRAVGFNDAVPRNDPVPAEPPCTTRNPHCRPSPSCPPRPESTPHQLHLHPGP